MKTLLPTSGHLYKFSFLLNLFYISKRVSSPSSPLLTPHLPSMTPPTALHLYSEGATPPLEVKKELPLICHIKVLSHLNMIGEIGPSSSLCIKCGPGIPP